MVKIPIHIFHNNFNARIFILIELNHAFSKYLLSHTVLILLSNQLEFLQFESNRLINRFSVKPRSPQ